MKTLVTKPLAASEPLFSKGQFMFLGSGLASLLLGYVLMAFDSQEYGYGFLGLTLGPLLVLTGFSLLFFAIFKNTERRKKKRFSLHKGVGWGVAGIALALYAFTAERTVSMWDCGEFISTAYKLQIPHPPGTPLFLLLGRFFSLFAPSKDEVAYAINLVSAVASSGTVLILFHTIYLLVKPMLISDQKKEVWATVAAAIGSLSFAFTDSFWFNATEAEVYALSCLFTAVVFWAMLKWREQETEKGEVRWMLFLAYLMGLSVGVHLLNLLAIPALAFLFYAKKYAFTWKGAFVTLLISCALILFCMEGIVIGVPAMASFFELFCVNGLGLPFGSGVFVFIVLLVALLVWGLLFTYKKKKQVLNLGLWMLVFALVGSSSIAVIPIRSAYNPPLDENDPQDMMNLLSYLKRDQYGTHPFLRGPHFTAGYPDEVIKDQPIYRKDGKTGRYEVCDYQYEYVYNKKHLTWLPRLYSPDKRHVEVYKEWLGLREGQKPTMKDNLQFLFQAQWTHMYWRYFLWNFMGRESDVQHAGWLTPWQGFAPEPLLGNSPNKARNNYLMIPLVLGLCGAYYHFKKRRQDASMLLLLFLFSGMAIVLYLNPPPIEPRERDYVYVGSFYAFAIWIGISVLWWLKVWDTLFFPFYVKIVLTSSVMSICPAILLWQNWDDHDRRGRYFAGDASKNVLQACEKDAILFTAADNDTFPLWYAQEVEEYRTDVRICNLSLLNMDWYVSSMKLKSNLSAPLPISVKINQYKRGKNDMLYGMENPNIKNGIALDQYLSLLKSESKALKYLANQGEEVTVLPSKKLFLPIDKKDIPNETLPLVSQMDFQVKGNVSKAEWVVWDIIVSNHWKRPIYFAPTALHDYPYLRKYTVKEGFVYRLVPLVPDAEGPSHVNTDKMYENLVQKAQWRGLDDTKVYIDPSSEPFIVNARTELIELASRLYTENKPEKAKEVVLFSLKTIPNKSIPYDHTYLSTVEFLLALKERKLALQIAQTLATSSEAYLKEKVKNKKRENEYQYPLYLLNALSEILARAGEVELSKDYAHKTKAFAQ